jgi:hypothetical protein
VTHAPFLLIDWAILALVYGGFCLAYQFAAVNDLIDASSAVGEARPCDPVTTSNTQHGCFHLNPQQLAAIP